MNVTLRDSLVSYENWLNKLAEAQIAPEGSYKVVCVIKPDSLFYGQVIFVDPRLNVKVVRLVDPEDWPEVRKLLSGYGPIYGTLNLVVNENSVSLAFSKSSGMLLPTGYGWASY
jgi:hypothetical protein